MKNIKIIIIEKFTNVLDVLRGLNEVHYQIIQKQELLILTHISSQTILRAVCSMSLPLTEKK
jgi:hypothetical protein